MPNDAFSDYFETLFDLALRQDPVRFALASLAHAALHSLNHKALTRRMSVLGCALANPLPFENAFRQTHPELHCAIHLGDQSEWRVQPHGGRQLAALFFDAPPPEAMPDLTRPDSPPILAALLAEGSRFPDPVALHKDFPGFTLMLRT